MPITNIILFDDQTWHKMLPLCFTRSVAELKVGILSIQKKWELYTGLKASLLSVDYLRTTGRIQLESETVFINSSVLPNKDLLKEIEKLREEEALVSDSKVIAVKTEEKHPPLIHKASGEWLPMLDDIKSISSKVQFETIENPWDIFSKNGQAIKDDFELLKFKDSKTSLSKMTGVHFFGDNKISVHPSAKIRPGVILNAENGPIHIGENCEIMEAAMIRGPFSILHSSTVKMGAKVYGDTSIGPHVKIAGEVSNVVFFGYANKAHDGYLGNSVIGEWCNLGADTNCSNLKNNYGKVKSWSYNQNEFINTDLQFCGLIMGDHSKCGINTMFNTGTIVGVSANIYGGDFPPKFIPSFSWGGANGFKTYRIEDAIKTAEKVYKRRNKVFSPKEESIFRNVLENTQELRTWE